MRQKYFRFTPASPQPGAQLCPGVAVVPGVELLTINRQSCTITEKAPTKAFSQRSYSNSELNNFGGGNLEIYFV